jgi:hypothetical protein
MVQPAEGYGKAVADFPSHRPLFCKLDVVRIRRDPAANKAGLRGHKLQVFAVTISHRLADNSNRFLTKISLKSLIVSANRFLMLRRI